MSSRQAAIRALEALGEELDRALRAAVDRVQQKHDEMVRGLRALGDDDGDDFDDADLLEAAIEVLRPLQCLSDGQGNTYCASCKQSGGCHPDCKLGAVLKVADERDAALERRQGAVIEGDDNG